MDDPHFATVARALLDADRYDRGGYRQYGRDAVRPVKRGAVGSIRYRGNAGDRGGFKF